MTRLDKLLNAKIKGSLEVVDITNKIEKNRLRWLRHVERDMYSTLCDAG